MGTKAVKLMERQTQNVFDPKPALCTEDEFVDHAWLKDFESLCSKHASETATLEEIQKKFAPMLGDGDLETWQKETSEQLQEWEDQGKLKKWGVTERQAALIFSFTLEEPGIYSIASKVVNDREKREAQRNKDMQAVMPFISNFLDALATLPESFDRGPLTAYRGMSYSYPDEEWDTRFKKGEVIGWHTLKSVSLDEKEAEKFCGAGPSTIFEIHGCRGKLIKKLSKFGREAELVLRPGARFRVELAQRKSKANRDRVLLTYLDSHVVSDVADKGPKLQDRSCLRKADV